MGSRGCNTWVSLVQIRTNIFRWFCTSIVCGVSTLLPLAAGCPASRRPEKYGKKSLRVTLKGPVCLVPWRRLRSLVVALAFAGRP